MESTLQMLESWSYWVDSIISVCIFEFEYSIFKQKKTIEEPTTLILYLMLQNLINSNNIISVLNLTKYPSPH